MARYRRSPTGVGVALDLIGDSLHTIAMNSRNAEQIYNEIILREEELLREQHNIVNLKDTKNMDEATYQFKVDEITKELSVLKIQKEYARQQKELENAKKENQEYNVFKQQNKRQNERLYDYLVNLVNALIEDNQDTTYKELFKLFKKNECIHICYNAYLVDKENDHYLVKDIEIDFMEFSKVYLQAVHDIEKTYKGDIETEKENERIDKLNRKIKTENNLIIAGMFTGIGRFLDKLDKKR